MTELVGWLATAFIIGSFFFKDPLKLRIAQMIGALVWICYGVLISSNPVIIANALVIVAILVTEY